MPHSTEEKQSDDISPELISRKESSMTVFEHIDELRARLVQIFAAVILCSAVSYVFVDHILAFITEPVGNLVFTAPSDAFLARIVLALFAGCLISFPFTLFHVWRFVGLGLRPQEAKRILFYGPCSLFLFLAGGVFAYFVIIPIALNFLLGFSTENIVPMITIKNYVSFVGTLILAFGVVFELPLVMLFLSHIGIATAEFLQQQRRYAIVIILILSAIITPPDFVTQLMMAGPLIILYEIGLLIIRLKGKRPTG